MASLVLRPLALRDMQKDLLSEVLLHCVKMITPLQMMWLI